MQRLTLACGDAFLLKKKERLQHAELSEIDKAQQGKYTVVSHPVGQTRRMLSSTSDRLLASKNCYQ